MHGPSGYMGVESKPRLLATCDTCDEDESDEGKRLPSVWEKGLRLFAMCETTDASLRTMHPVLAELVALRP